MKLAPMEMEKMTNILMNYPEFFVYTDPVGNWILAEKKR